MSSEVVFAASALLSLAILAGAALVMWQGWLSLKLRELESLRHAAPDMIGGSREGAARIEIADLKERIRKLEAIASGVDL